MKLKNRKGGAAHLLYSNEGSLGPVNVAAHVRQVVLAPWRVSWLKDSVSVQKLTLTFEDQKIIYFKNKSGIMYFTGMGFITIIPIWTCLTCWVLYVRIRFLKRRCDLSIWFLRILCLSQRDCYNFLSLNRCGYFSALYPFM